MKLAVLLFMFSTPVFALSVQTYSCAPYPRSPGFGDAVQVFVNAANNSSELKLIKEGRAVETVATRELTQMDGETFVDAATNGDSASLTIKNTWVKNAGYVSLFFNNGVNASYTCTPKN